LGTTSQAIASWPHAIEQIHDDAMIGCSIGEMRGPRVVAEVD
jgi:hypothetical protein